MLKAEEAHLSASDHADIEQKLQQLIEALNGQAGIDHIDQLMRELDAAASALQHAESTGESSGRGDSEDGVMDAEFEEK